MLRKVGLAVEDIVLEIDGMQAHLPAAAAGLGVLGVFRPKCAGTLTPPGLHSLPWTVTCPP